MGDDDNGLSVVPHIPQDGEQLVRLLGYENCRWLIQNQNIRAAVQHLHDLHRLLLRDGHVVDLLIGIHLKAVGVADGFDPFRCLRKVQPPWLMEAKDDVFHSGEHIHQLEMLMDHTDAVAIGVRRVPDYRFFSVHIDPALVGEIDTGEHVHKGGFAAAVFPQQGQDFSPVNVQPDLVVCHNRSESLCDVTHFYCGGFAVQRLHSLSV